MRGIPQLAEPSHAPFLARIPRTNSKQQLVVVDRHPQQEEEIFISQQQRVVRGKD
jgi:hypothetical protein